MACLCPMEATFSSVNALNPGCCPLSHFLSAYSIEVPVKLLLEEKNNFTSLKVDFKPHSEHKEIK